LVVTEDQQAKRRVTPIRKSANGEAPDEIKRAHELARRETEALLCQAAPALMRKAIDRALDGDAAASRLCLERILPASKERSVRFDMPKVESASDAAKLMGAILDAVAAGAVTPAEASEIARLVETYVKTLEAAEVEQRLTALEQRSSAAARSARRF